MAREAKSNSLQTSGTVLLGDVGGTNCRLALQSGEDGTILARETYSTDDFPSPREAIGAFIANLKAPAPHAGALAIAAPTLGDRVRLTNTSWAFDRGELSAAFSLSPLLLVNDLGAQARAMLDLEGADFKALGEPGAAPLQGVVSIVGPGTGLGVARLDTEAPVPVTATEGGHVGFAPGDDVEMELLRLWRQHLGRVSNEHVVSGPGMVRLYRALGALLDAHVEPIAGPEIVERALAGADTLCVETTERFSKILGAVVGDVVLAQGAGAAVLVGGIPNAMAPIIARGGFRARFEQRGPGGSFLARTPSLIATVADLGLTGASAYLADALKASSA